MNEEDAAAFTFWLLIAAFVLASIQDHFLGPGCVSYPGETDDSIRAKNPHSRQANISGATGANGREWAAQASDGGRVTLGARAQAEAAVKVTGDATGGWL